MEERAARARWRTPPPRPPTHTHTLTTRSSPARLPPPPPQFEYLRLHPSLYSPLLQFTIASACGQAFIFFVIREFGALMNTQVTTLRKLFTIVWTEVVSPKPGSSGLKMTQWAAVLLVFVGLYIGESAKSHGGGKAAGHAAVAGAPSAAQPSGDKAAEAAAPPGAKPAGKAAPSPQE